MQEKMVSIPVGYVLIPLEEYNKLLLARFNEHRLNAGEFRTDKTGPKPPCEKSPGSVKVVQNKAASPAPHEDPAEADQKTVQNAEWKPGDKKVSEQMIVKINSMRIGGSTVQQIAREMDLSESTVRRHLDAYAKDHINVVRQFAKNSTPLADSGRRFE